MDSILIITVDSLRYDAAIMAKGKNIARLIGHYQHAVNNWVKVYAPGTYTLPSHVSMFSGGILPNNYNITIEPYGRWNSLFKYEFSSRSGTYTIANSESIPAFFSSIGFRTIGIGGVGWFSSDRKTSSIWHNLFSEFYWNENFSEGKENAFVEQINLVNRLDIRSNYFLFINVSYTHKPFLGLEPKIESQAECYRKFDNELPELLDILPKPVKVIITGDHGECFGEDNQWGHGFYHLKVMEVPMIYLEIK